MKNKNKVYFFGIVLFFLNIFFIRIDGIENIAKAGDNCFDQCKQDTDNTDEDCVNACGGSPYNYCQQSYGGSVVSDGNGECSCSAGSEWNASGTACVTAGSGGGSDTGDITNEQGGNVTQADCDSYGSAPGQYVVNGDQTNCVLVDTSSQECGANETLVNGDCYCNDGYSEDANGNCEKIDLNSESCESDGDCTSIKGSGYKCDTDSGSCVPSGFAGLTGDECRTNQDCLDNYGEGYTCSGLIRKTCDNTSGSGSGSGGSIIQSTKDTLTKSGINLPTGSTINTSTGVATLPNGSTVQLPSSDITAITNTGSGGSSTFTRTNTGSGGLSGTVAGTYGLTSPKCGANFQDVGGVCFPTNTGLSNAPIYVILSNIFSWLMGLFTTFAVLAFVIAGVQYLLAAGDESLAEKAKENATYAIIGIIVGLSGFIIIKAIAAALSGQSILF